MLIDDTKDEMQFSARFTLRRMSRQGDWRARTIEESSFLSPKSSADLRVMRRIALFRGPGFTFLIARARH